MLPREGRLKKKKDFGLVIKKGKGFKEDLLILKFICNELGKNRFGISVSQRVSKKAVVRNKIKRRIASAIGLKPEIKKGLDIVLIALPGIETKNFLEIRKTINKLFEKAKIINLTNEAGKEN